MARLSLSECGINGAGETAQQLTNSDHDKCDLLIWMDRISLPSMYHIYGGDFGGKTHYTDYLGDVADLWFTDDLQ